MLCESETSLSIHVRSATELISVQTFGKQDPFFQFALNYEDKDSFLKTFTHKNAGETATWDQTFTVPLNGEPDLFVEILDEESSVDEVIGFAAIPINQVVFAEGAYLNGLFELFDTKGERAGFVNLQLAAQGFPNSRTPDFNCEPVQGQSYVHDGHCARMKSSEKKATGVTVAGGLLGVGLAIGAGFLAKKLYDDQQEEEEAQRLQEEEAQRLQEEEDAARREEEEKLQQEREEFEQERARFESEKAERYEEEANEEEANEEEDCERESRCHEHDGEECDGDHSYERRNSSSSNDDDDESAEKWDPVGTYAAGDRVKYHGQVYVCLQDHTTNPTWQPSVAHSLWQTE
ncbi:hypothetical protein INT47_002078 [Mucor saturninus]|uniref:C2 domain-containing protein n=1 Tax=Mucor saturninus TaxID=64648 RepID=A0A8H7R1G9_9FUNG|nr:hypothetical protein INT47_002078 [Mucor saturninus]